MRSIATCAEQTGKARVEVWAYCLAPNHVHIIMTPQTADGLGRAVGEAHRRHANVFNPRGAWAGQLFQRRAPPLREMERQDRERQG